MSNDSLEWAANIADEEEEAEEWALETGEEEEIGLRDEDRELLGRVPVLKHPESQLVPELRSRHPEQRSKPYFAYGDPILGIVTGEIQFTDYGDGRLRVDARSRGSSAGQFERHIHAHAEEVSTSGTSTLLRADRANLGLTQERPPKKRSIPSCEFICPYCGSRNYRREGFETIDWTCNCGRSL